jgi:hypothetical protein
MSESRKDGIGHPAPGIVGLRKYRYVSPEEFATSTGANAGFVPAHAGQWMIFWQEDIFEKDQFHTEFPSLSLPDAQRLWLAMEEQLLSQYEEFLRVCPEWCSSGIWWVPYPGSRRAGEMVDYQHLLLPMDLVDRFKAWQAEFDSSPPCGPVELDWDRFSETAEGLARDPKRCVGPRIYVERDKLVEVLMDGTTRDWGPILGRPKSERR